MSEIRMKGLAGIDMADIPVNGGVPADEAWVSVGVTYRDEATLTEDDPTETEHYSNENDDPEESDITAGKRKLAFALIDVTPATMVKFMGGEVTGEVGEEKWEAPSQKAKIEKAFRIRSKNGQHIIFPRVSFYGKLDYKLAPSGIAKIMVAGTVMTPTGAGVKSVIKGGLIPEVIPEFAFTSPALFVSVENQPAIGQITTNFDSVIEIVGGADAAKVTLDEDNNLTWVENPNFEVPGDEDEDNLYMIQISATRDGETIYQYLNVQVVDEEEPVFVFTSPALFSIESYTSFSGQVTTNEPSVIEISGGNDELLFQIDEDGLITSTNAFDYYNPLDNGADNIYELTVSATSASGTITQNISIVILEPESYLPENDPELDIQVTSRVGNLLIDSKSGFNPVILPAVYKGNNSGYYAFYTSALFAADSWLFDFELELNSVPAANNITFFGQGAQMYFKIRSVNDWYFFMTDGTNNRHITISTAVLPFQVRKYNFSFFHDKNGNTEIYENGVLLGTASGAFTNLSSAGSARYNYFGYNGADGNLLSNKASLIAGTLFADLARTIINARYIFTGDATAYDISGNNKHAVGQTVVVANKGYSKNGSLYCLDEGYTIWEKSGSPDIIAPTGVTTNPIAAGYSIARVFLGKTNEYNFADSLVGFNETGSLDAKLAIFDRSNEATHTAGNWVSPYYDNTSLATKCRYHASELFPHEKLLSLFTADAQERLIGKINKVNGEFSFSEILMFSEKKQGSELGKIKTYCNSDGVYYVGSANNLRKIQRGISFAYAGNTLNIATGSYSELLDLTTKQLNLVGNGNRETIINYVIAGQATSPTVNIGTASTFTNIIFDHEENTVSIQPILNINNANPVFTNCKIGRSYYLTDYKSQKPFVIQGTSQVQMLLCTLVGKTGTYSDVKDTASLTFTGDYIKGSILRIANSAELNLTLTDKYYTAGMPNSTSIVLKDTANAVIDLKAGTKYFNTTTGADKNDGDYASFIYLYNDAQLDITGTDIHDGIKIESDAVNAYVKVHDVTREKGFALITTSPGAAATVLAEVYDSRIIHDCDDAVSGRHLYELGAEGHEIRFFDCHLEWTGFSGNWDTLGNPMYGFGKLVMRRCTLIDSIDDGSVSYLITFGLVGQVDIEDCTITQTNYTGTVNQIIGIQKGAGLPFKVRLKNVDFIDGGNTGYIIWNNQTPSYNVNDMAYIENCTINGVLINPQTLVRLYNDNSGGGLPVLQTLLSNWIE